MLNIAHDYKNRKMKISVVIFTLLIFTSTLKAQDIRFSFLANPELTWFSGSGNGYEANGNFIGLNTGIELDFFFAENYAFSTGLTINTMKGGVIFSDSMHYDVNDASLTLLPGSRLVYTLQHVSVPLGLKFKSIEIGYSTYWINTGITPMVLIKSRVTDDQEIFNQSGFKDHTNLFNLNYFVEGGLEYSLGGNTALIAGIGYYSGITDITKNDTNKLTMRGFALTLGMLF